jgi:hypothetical protein
MLKCAAVLQVGRDAGSSKCVAASGVGEGGRLRPPLYHVEDVKAGHRFVGELVASVHAAEKPRLLVARDIRGPDVRVRVALVSNQVKLPP